MSKKPLLIVVTGLSGGGMSSAMNALADNGFYVIDNLPMELLDAAVTMIESGSFAFANGVGIGMDIRNPRFVERFPSLREAYGDKVDLRTVFLSADIETIAKRYSTTRRKHPLLTAGETLTQAIAREMTMLEPVEKGADVGYDTSHWSPYELARKLESYLEESLPKRKLHLSISSFGFKHGLQDPLDTLFDVRFIKNPFFEAELKDKTGLEQPVQSFVFQSQEAVEMLDRIEDFIRFTLPKYYAEGKHYFRLGIACSGGRHRSVSFVEKIFERLSREQIANVVLTKSHRDIEKH